MSDIYLNNEAVKIHELAPETPESKSRMMLANKKNCLKALCLQAKIFHVSKRENFVKFSRKISATVLYSLNANAVAFFYYPNLHLINNNFNISMYE